MLMKTRPRDDGGEGGEGGGQTWGGKVPFRIHRKRCGPPSYHRRVQKKWVKRWGLGTSPALLNAYCLVGTRFFQPRDMWTWTRLFEADYRVIGSTLFDKVRVSTVFLGLDHSFTRSGAPVLFESMIFGEPAGEYQERYRTYAEAAAGHAALVATMQAKYPEVAPVFQVIPKRVRE